MEPRIKEYTSHILSVSTGNKQEKKLYKNGCLQGLFGILNMVIIICKQLRGIKTLYTCGVVTKLRQDFPYSYCRGSYSLSQDSIDAQSVKDLYFHLRPIMAVNKPEEGKWHHSQPRTAYSPWTAWVADMNMQRKLASFPVEFPSSLSEPVGWRTKP